MENQECRCNNHKGLITILITIIVILALAVGHFVWKDYIEVKKVTSSTEGSQTQNVGKINNSKEYVYNATYATKDIVAPYININSDYVKVVNKEIKVFVDKMKATDERPANPWYSAMKYTDNINGNILSVVLTLNYGLGTSATPNYYKVYNINLKTGDMEINNDILKYKKITEDAFITATNKLIEDKTADVNNDTSITGDQVNIYQAEGKHMFQEQRYRQQEQLFLDKDGKMNVICNIQQPNSELEDEDYIFTLN